MRYGAAAEPMTLNLRMCDLLPPASHFPDSGDLSGSGGGPGGASGRFSQKSIERRLGAPSEPEAILGDM